MKKIIKLIFIAEILILGGNSVYAELNGGNVEVKVEFPMPQLTPSNYLTGYSHIEMQGLRSLGKVGEPVLPVKGLKVLIPVDSKVKDIELILGEKFEFPQRCRIEPGQKEYPLSEIGKIKIVPDEPKEEIYESENLYPPKLYKLGSLSLANLFIIRGLRFLMKPSLM